MIKKILLFLFLGLLLFLVVKGLFFSGITQEASAPANFKNAEKPGFVWTSAGPQYEKGKLGAFFFGEHYRDVWTAPVRAPIFDIDSLPGDYSVDDLGGGMQTTSLSLTSPTGPTYVLRSLDKDPIEVLPPFWQKTFIADFLRDQIAAANPYAAVVVAALAEAAHVPHTNPKVVFISKAKKQLQPYQDLLGDKLYLLEEKYNSSSLSLFPEATAILNSVEMLGKRFRYQGHLIDQKAYARARLFDILIGDWDRHEGQWNWAAYPAGDATVYKPIPKDRDQAFSLYQDGLLPWLLTRDFALRKFGHFSPDIDVNAYTVNSSFLDERALNELTAADFKAIAQSLKRELTAAEIEQAVRKFPEPIFKIAGQETAQKLKSRQRDLVRAAMEFYKILAKQVTVAGTDERDKFEITRLNDSLTSVKIFQVSATDSIGRLWYSRIFRASETEEITLHGLAADDIFLVIGKVNTGIVININGGLGEDDIRDVSVVSGREPKTIIYDTQNGNDIIWTPEMEDKTTSDISVHNYDREGY